MSGGMAKKGDESMMTVSKKPRTEQLCKQSTESIQSGFHVQTYDHNKPWSLHTDAWRLVELPCFNVVLNASRGIGITIVPPAYMQPTTHVNLIPYGPDGMKFTDRDGCGGPVPRGQALLWKCGSLLHCEYSTKDFALSVDVMVVHLDYTGHLDEPVVEEIVRAKFYVDGDDDITQPSWKLGSVEQNERAYFKECAQERSKQILQLKVANMAQQQQLQVYKVMHESFKEIAICAICRKPAPAIKPCMLAPCGHHACEECFDEYFQSLGVYDNDPACSTCRKPAPRSEWSLMWVMTGVVSALNKADTALNKADSVQESRVEELD